MSIVILLDTFLREQIFNLVNQMVPMPIEDEVIHVRQAQRYWKGDYRHWDNRITTPPGLYIASLMLKPLQLLDILPDVSFLRWSSFMFGLLITFLNPSKGLLIMSLPIVFPYQFLYYTDVPSLFFVLLAEKLFESNHALFSAVSCFISLAFRQTNVVWTARLTGLTCMRLYTQGTLEKRKYIVDIFPFGIVILLFISFVIWNKGIVLGDRANHKPSIVPVQFILLFVLMTVLCASTFTWKDLTETVITFKNISMLSNLNLCASTLLFLQVYRPHSYQRTGDRHIACIFISKILLSKLSSFFVPLCVFVQTMFMKKIIQTLGWYEGSIFIICSCLAVVPSRLVEPRYFIVPTALYLYHAKLTESQIQATFIYHMLINGVLLCLLVGRFKNEKPMIW